MKNRTLQVLFLALTGVAATAHCGKGRETSGTPALGPTDVVVTWTFAGKPASAAECMGMGHPAGVKVKLTLSATSDPALHPDTSEACEKGTLTFAALDIAALGMPFLEGTLLDDQGITVTRADVTVTPVAGKTAVTLDFFPIPMMTTGATTGDTTVTTGDTTSATSGGGGMGGMGGGTATSSASSSSSASASSSASGAGGADAGP